MMQSYPLVTVCIPVYNHEKYIKELLDSILFDNYPNKEIAIINDGSTDKSASVIENWIEINKEKIIISYKTRSNKGVCATLNELLKLSRGDYITIIASDDLLIDGGIIKRVEYLLNSPYKDAVFGDCLVIDNNGKLLLNSGLSELYSAHKEKYFTDSGLKKEILINWSIPGPVLLSRKELYVNIGLYDETLSVEDWDFYLRMVAKDKLGFLDFKVAKYRVHESNFAKLKKTKVLDDRIKTAWKNLYLFSFPYKVLLLYGISYLYLLRIYRKIKYYAK